MTDARAFRGCRFPAEVIPWAVRWYPLRPHSALGYHPPAPEATPRPVGTCPPSARLGLGPAAVLR